MLTLLEVPPIAVANVSAVLAGIPAAPERADAFVWTMLMALANKLTVLASMPTVPEHADIASATGWPCWCWPACEYADGSGRHADIPDLLSGQPHCPHCTTANLQADCVSVCCGCCSGIFDLDGCYL
mmetsp:Transcript_802/g.2167  ORF Transcript_802/g.2167 Transcript_802/m.2167 type:complete len:127 (-) Transcript_802:582-962(-)|eukprot:355796-Chlamydomonas_euryale.AAC.1